MNKVILVGNLGSDAELRALSNGATKVGFRLATSERFNDAHGQKQERTEWHRCVWFGDRAQKVAQYLTKGKTILVEGKLESRVYDKDGQQIYVTEVVVRDLELLGGPGGQRQNRPRQQGLVLQKDDSKPDNDDDQLPF